MQDVDTETKSRMGSVLTGRPHQTPNDDQLVLNWTTFHSRWFSSMYCPGLPTPEAPENYCHYTFTIGCNKPTLGTRHAKASFPLLIMRCRPIAGDPCAGSLTASLWKSPFIVAQHVKENTQRVSGPSAAFVKRGPCHMAAVAYRSYPEDAQHLRGGAKVGRGYVVKWTVMANSGTDGNMQYGAMCRTNMGARKGTRVSNYGFKELQFLAWSLQFLLC